MGNQIIDECNPPALCYPLDQEDSQEDLQDVIDFEESDFSRQNANILKSYRPNISKMKTFKKSLDKKHIPQLVNRGYQPLYQSPVVKIALKNIR